MAMTTCKECKKEVSDTAKTCPHCGRTFKRTEHLERHVRTRTLTPTTYQHP